MSIATKKRPEPAVASSPATPVTIHSRIHAAINRHEGLADAKEKLVDLESRMAAKQSELDQIEAAVGNPDLAVCGVCVRVLQIPCAGVPHSTRVAWCVN